MEKRTCSIDGCDKPHEGRGYCNKHYRNWRRCGDPLGMQIQRQVACTFEGCDRPHESHGYCSTHASQLRQGKELKPARAFSDGTCKVDGCSEPHCARGYCNKHWRRWRTHGDPMRVDQGREGSRKYLLDESFFNDIDTEQKAYWLGFITADGCIIESGTTHALRVELSVRDTDHLEQMCSDLGSTRPVSHRRTFASVSFDSWRLVDALKALGITPRKSATVQPWSGPDDLMPHYWRGMFDGDGSIYRTTRDGVWNLKLVGSEACIRAFAAWASDICGSKARPSIAKGSCWGWTVCGGRSPQALARVLYGESTVALGRKLDLAKTLLGVDFDEVKAAAAEKKAAAMREAWASGRHPRARTRLQ